MQLTDQGGYVAFESFDTKSIFYTKGPDFSVPLFGKSLSGGPERQILDPVIEWAFCVTEGGIYHLATGVEKGSYPLKFYGFATGKEKVLFTLDVTPEQGLSVSPDCQTRCSASGRG